MKIIEPIRDKIRLNNPTMVVFALFDTMVSGFQDMLFEGYMPISISSRKMYHIIIYSKIPFPTIKSYYCEPNPNKQNIGLLVILELVKGHRMGFALTNINDRAEYKQILKYLVYSTPMEYVTLMARFQMSSVNCQPETAIFAPDICIKDNLVPEFMSEGINNRGPEFAPTCYLSKTRVKNLENHALLKPYNPNASFTAPLIQHQVESVDFQPNKINWCDRIFYGRFQRAYPLEYMCTEYNRIDDPDTVLKLSEHSIVYGLYTFET
jgi:hypothetical protein